MSVLRSVRSAIAKAVRRAVGFITDTLYGAGGHEPVTIVDFEEEFYRGVGVANFTDLITHVRNSNAVMTDGYGPELVVNGSYSDGTTGWTASNATLSVDNGELVITSTGGARPQAYQTITTVIGKTYEISAIARSTSSAGTLEIEIAGTASDASARTASLSNKRIYNVFVATSTSHIVQVKIDDGASAAGETAYFDSVSVREMPVLKWAPHNLCRNSEDATESNFFKSNVTVTSVSSVTAPNGTTGVNKYEFAGAAGDNVYITDGGADIRGGVTGTFAVFAKAVSSATTIRMRIWDNGTTGAQYADKSVSADDWTLLTHEATTSSNSTTANFAIYNNSSGNASDIYVWGFHIFRSDLGGMVDNPERGDSYVPTALRLTGPELATSTTQSGTITVSTTPWYSAENTGQWSVSSNAVSRASGGTWESVRRSFGMQTNKAYVISFDVTGRTTGSVSVYRDFSTVFLTASENGSYTGFFIPVNPTNGDKIQFGSANFDGTIENISIRETSVRPDTARYLPRIGHHVYNGSAWVNEGLLAESEARTNLLPYSTPDSNWNNSNSTDTANQAIAPDGTETATLVVDNTQNQNHYIESIAVNTAGSGVTGSIYVKKNSISFARLRLDATTHNSRAWFDIENGTVGSVDPYGVATIQDVGNGWFRCSLSEPNNIVSGNKKLQLFLNTADNQTNYVGDGSGVYIWGAQLEVAATPSSLVPTDAGASVTRAAETFTIPSANLPWPSPQYIGSELVTNGTFDTNSDWTLSTNVSISSGKLNFNATNTNFIGANQSVSFVSGKVYQISVGVDSVTSGEWQVFVARTSGDKSVIGGTSAGSFSGIYVSDGTETNFYVARRNATTLVAVFDNVSVREINPLSVSIAMNGRMTYADINAYSTVIHQRWYESGNDLITFRIDTFGIQEGHLISQQNESGVADYATAQPANTAYAPDILVPFDIASRYGSTFIQIMGEARGGTANTTPTALPDLSSTDLELAYRFMGTIRNFRVWDKDIGDAGLVEATQPSTEPSLSLTFEGTGNGSFIVNDWSE